MTAYCHSFHLDRYPFRCPSPIGCDNVDHPRLDLITSAYSDCQKMAKIRTAVLTNCNRNKVDKTWIVLAALCIDKQCEKQRKQSESVLKNGKNVQRQKNMQKKKKNLIMTSIIIFCKILKDQ